MRYILAVFVVIIPFVGNLNSKKIHEIGDYFSGVVMLMLACLLVSWFVAWLLVFSWFACLFACLLCGRPYLCLLDSGWMDSMRISGLTQLMFMLCWVGLLTIISTKLYVWKISIESKSISWFLFRNGLKTGLKLGVQLRNRFRVVEG